MTDNNPSTTPGLDWSIDYPFTPADFAAALGLADEDPTALNGENHD